MIGRSIVPAAEDDVPVSQYRRVQVVAEIVGYLPEFRVPLFRVVDVQYGCGVVPGLVQRCKNLVAPLVASTSRCLREVSHGSAI